MKSFAVRYERSRTLTATGFLASAGKRIGVTLSHVAPAAISLILMAGVMAVLLVASGRAGVSPARDPSTEPPAITQPWVWRSDNLATTEMKEVSDDE